MRIAILGAGNMGGNLARVWSKAGHEIVFGVLDPSGPKVGALLAELGPPAWAATDDEAAAAGEVVTIATPWPVSCPVMGALRPHVAGKVVLDCTNPLLPDLSGLEVGHTTSAAEEIARCAPEARVVKAFNTIGYAAIGDSMFGGSPLTGFYCGDDPEAKRVAHGLIEQAGFAPFDAGPLDKARMLEQVAMFWIHLAVKQGLGRDQAFGLVRK
jgi:predicted dinucleotide-binding enzyme